MIAANKRLLKATLTQGVLGIQITLIQLYTQNLTAVATQAALLAGFAFAAISSPLDWKEITEAQYILSYFFYFCFTICLIAALYALSQATIVTMFGPSMALKADDSDAVRIASEFMRQQQVKVFNIGVIAISALFIGSAVLTWAIYPLPIAGLCCLCYLFGYYTVLVEGAKAFEIFVPHLDVTVDDELKGAQQFFCCILWLCCVLFVTLAYDMNDRTCCSEDWLPESRFCSFLLDGWRNEQRR